MLYYYISDTLSSSSGGFGDSVVRNNPFGGHSGRFLAGGPTQASMLQRSASAMPAELDFSVPTVHLHDGEEHHLIVYQVRPTPRILMH